MWSINSIGVGVLIVFLAACSGEHSGSSTNGTSDVAGATNNGEPAGATDGGSTASDGGDWELVTTNSSIDGKVVIAKRMYTPDEQTNLLATVKCVPGNGAIGITIDSYMGSEGDSLPGSAFSTTVVTNLLGIPRNAPVGRAKPNGGEVLGLSELFALSNVASNEIVLMQPSLYGNLVHVPDQIRPHLSEGDINYARVVADMLPLSVEVNNETGKHEFVIDPSPQVVQALGQCGAKGDLVPAEVLAKVQAAAQAAQQASEEAKRQADARIAEREAESEALNRQYCRNRGSHSSFKAMCEEKYPEDLAAFQEEIDQLLAIAKQKRCKIERDEIEEHSAGAGIDAARSRIEQMPKCSWLN